MPHFDLKHLEQHLSPDIRELNPELFSPQTVGRITQLSSPSVNLLGANSEFVGTHTSEKGKRANKYGARKVTIGDKTFDSQKEARRYLVLHGQYEAGEINFLICQYKITLVEGFEYHGEKVRAIEYTADFCYTKDGITYIEDVKSEATARTEAFRIRWRLLQRRYKDVEDVRCVVT